MRAVIKATFNGGASTSTTAFYINGVSVGQWSEEHNNYSLGSTATAVTSPAIAIATTSGVEAEAYGLGGDSGYYLINDNALVARNSTILSPNTAGEPSLIIPGKGFLNEAGQYKEYTVEFWTRINSNATTPKRIFGPIASSDGLYVESGFLTFVIGNNFGSHFVNFANNFRWKRSTRLAWILFIHRRIPNRNRLCCNLFISGSYSSSKTQVGLWTRSCFSRRY